MTTRSRKLAFVAVFGIASWFFVREMTTTSFEQFLDQALPLTGADVLQLLYPPESSVARLTSEPALNDPFRYPGREGFGFLKREHGMPAEGFCVGIRNEEGRWDALRCRYRIGDWDYEVAANQVIRSVRISGAELNERSVEIVARVASEVFPYDEDVGLPAAGLELKVMGDDGRVMFGRHDTAVREVTKVRYWRDDVIWYHDGAAVGFLLPIPIATEIVHVVPGAMRAWLKSYVDAVSFPFQVGAETQQLVDAPASSLRVLDTVATGNEPPEGVLVLDASSSSVADFPLLRPEFRLGTADRLCLGFPMEAGVVDVVRCRYERRGVRLESAAKPDQVAIWTRASPSSNKVDALYSVADRLFEFRVDRPVKVSLNDDKLAYGSIRTGGGWLRWWSAYDGTVGFIADRELEVERSGRWLR